MKNIFSGSIRRKVFGMLLITIILLLTAYTAIFLYQTKVMEKMVNDTYEEQKQVYVDNGLEDEYEAIRTGAVDSFRNQMFHARNILILLVVFIVASPRPSPSQSASSTP